MSLTLRDIRILDPDSGRDEIGHLRIEDGKIAALGPDPVSYTHLTLPTILLV